MPITFTKEEIRQFLKEQGYDVSEERTLKKFIHDFKKLIKFEEMKRRRRRLGHLPEETVLDSTDGRYANTTTTSTQDTTSFEDDDLRNRNNDVVDRRDNRRGDERSPRRAPPPSPSKGSPRRPVTPAKKYPPNQQQKGRQDGSGETQSYGTDGNSSFENSYQPNNHRDRVPPTYDDKFQRSPRSGRPDQSTKNTSAGSAAPKKPGNRLVMKRITASQSANGDSVIEESDIDLGPRRAVNKFVRKPPVAGHSRPQTAPVSKGGKSGVGPNQSGRPPHRPTSARSEQQGQGEPGEDPCDFAEADELFQALNELIFPSDQIDSQDSLFTESDRQKTLLKPPPHVARDPVLLYHWYKTYNWDVYTIPGEDRHMKLRWNVRAKTVGGYHPCVEARNFYKPKSHCC